jgi:hypothetical protein
MKFDTPATTNPIDQLKVIGKPTDRVDGPLKTTGTAPYAYERHDVAPDAAYGYVVGAGIAKGRIASMDLRAARAAPGVLAIVTARNAGKLGKGNFNTAKLLGGPRSTTTTRPSPGGGRHLRAGARGCATGAHQLRRARRASTTSRPRRRRATSQGHFLFRPVGIEGGRLSPAPSPRRRCSSTPPTPRPTRRTP